MNTPHPKEDANGWIKFVEASPNPDEWGKGIFCCTNGKMTVPVLIYDPTNLSLDGAYTHWKRYELKGPCGGNKDDDIMEFIRQNGICQLSPLTAWHAALAWERSRNKSYFTNPIP